MHIYKYFCKVDSLVKGNVPSVHLFFFFFFNDKFLIRFLNQGMTSVSRYTGCIQLTVSLSILLVALCISGLGELEDGKVFLACLSGKYSGPL